MFQISIIVIWIFACLVGVFTYGWWINVQDIDRKNDTLRNNWSACSLSYKWLVKIVNYGNRIRVRVEKSKNSLSFPSNKIDIKPFIR